MALTLTDDEIMLTDSVRGLLARAAPVSAFRALRDGGAPLRYEPAVFAELAANGFVAPNLSENDGGLGMGAAAAGLIAEQTGRTLAAAPLLSAAMAANLVAGAGNAEQKKDLLPRIVDGSLTVAIGLDETVRHDPTALATAASPQGADWTLNGKKSAVIDGIGAGLYVVSALVGGEPALFLVEPSTPGLTVTPVATIDSRNLAQLTLVDAAAVRLGGEYATKAIAATLDLGRALLAAELLGIADEAFERTVGYLKEREQFGRKIGTFQALQHRAARLYGRLDLARGVVLKALRAIDEGDAQASMLASLAKTVMTKLGRDTLVEALQMHGGIGMTDEFDIGLFVKRARVAGELLGDDYFHTERLARERWQI